MGRYLETDPLWLYPEKLLPIAHGGRTAPAYAYAANNPVTRADPDGQEAIIIDDGFNTAAFLKQDVLNAFEQKPTFGDEERQDEAAVAATPELAKAQAAQIASKDPKEPGTTVDMQGRSTDPDTGKSQTEYGVPSPQVFPNSTDRHAEIPTTGATAATMHAHVRPDGNKPSIVDYRSSTEKSKLNMYILTYSGTLVKIRAENGRMLVYVPSEKTWTKAAYGPADLR